MWKIKSRVFTIHRPTSFRAKSLMLMNRLFSLGDLLKCFHPSRVIRSGVLHKSGRRKSIMKCDGCERERGGEQSIARRLISWIFLLLNFRVSQRREILEILFLSPFTFSSTLASSSIEKWIFVFSFCFVRFLLRSGSFSCPLFSLSGARKRGENISRARNVCAKGFARISLRTQNNYGAWCRYLHSKYKPIIAIKFAIKYRIKMGRVSLFSAHNAPARRSFIVANCSLFSTEKPRKRWNIFISLSFFCASRKKVFPFSSKALSMPSQEIQRWKCK